MNKLIAFHNTTNMITTQQLDDLIRRYDALSQTANHDEEAYNQQTGLVQTLKLLGLHEAFQIRRQQLEDGYVPRVLITVSIVGEKVAEPTYSFALFAPDGMSAEDAMRKLEDLRDEYLEGNDGIFEPEGYVDFVSAVGFDQYTFCNHLVLDINDNRTLWENHYECSKCGEKWTDTHTCQCNDRCPNCNTEIEPTESVEIK